MKSFRKFVSVLSAFMIAATLACTSAAAEETSDIKSSVVLENNYDTVVKWDNDALFIKNGTVDSITDQTEMTLATSGGTTSAFENTQKFDKICSASKDTFWTYYSVESSLMIVGKDGKKALLKKDGSIVGDTWYEDILSATDHFAAVKEGDMVVVLKLDGCVTVKEYAADSSIDLKETDSSLLVLNTLDNVRDMFDKNLNKIDLSCYNNVEHYDNNYLQTTVGEKNGILSNAGKQIVPAEYSYVSKFTYRNAVYFYAENRDLNSKPINFTVFKDDGSVLINQTDGWMDISSDIRGYSLDNSSGYTYFCKNNAYGIYDFNTLTVKVEPTYQKILACDSHCFAYELDGKLGVKTYDNNDIVECGKYQGNDYICFIWNNHIVLNVENDQYTFTAYVYISDTGKYVYSYKAPDKYSYLLGYKNGLAQYVYWYGYRLKGLLDENGKIIASMGTYSNLKECSSINGQNLYVIGKNNKVGLIDCKGLPVTDVRYDAIGGVNHMQQDEHSGASFLIENNTQKFLQTELNGKYGLIKLTTAGNPTETTVTGTSQTDKKDTGKDSSTESPATGSSPVIAETVSAALIGSLAAIGLTKKKKEA